MNILTYHPDVHGQQGCPFAKTAAGLPETSSPGENKSPSSDLSEDKNHRRGSLQHPSSTKASDTPHIENHKNTVGSFQGQAALEAPNRYLLKHNDHTLGSVQGLAAVEGAERHVYTRRQKECTDVIATS